MGYTALTGLIQATTSGIPNPLPEKFMSTTRDVIGDAGRYTRVTGQRRTARLGKYGASALRRELKDVGSVDVKLMHTFEEQPIPPLVMQALRNYENYEVQKMGMQEVARQVKEFTQLFVNLRIATIMQVLANGILYFDGSGNLLPSSSGAVETISFQMNANNQNQLNGIIAASWATASTNIPLHLRNLKKRAAQLTGYELKYAFYGVNLPTYFTTNDYVLDYLSRNPTWSNKYLESEHGEIPDGLFGLTWIPVYNSFFEDSTGTNQEIVGVDKVIFTPDVSSDWWEVMQGSYLVPTSINITTDAGAAMNSLKQVYGMFGYGLAGHNPVTVNTFYGDTFLPVIRNPDVVFQADVTP